MKKTLILLFALCPFAHAMAQGFYVKLGGSYAIPLASQSLMESSDIRITLEGNNTVVTTTTEDKMGSYATGVFINAGIGYKFSPFIGVDLAVGYQPGKKYEANSLATNGTSQNTLRQQQKSSGFYISPALLLMAGSEKVRPYALVGVAMASVKIKEEIETDISGREGLTNFFVAQETTGKLAFGFRGGAGVDFEISNKFCVYGEAIFQSMSYQPKEREVTKATIDDEDVLDDQPMSFRKVVYVDKLVTRTVNDQDDADEDEPSEELRPRLPLSSLTFTVGIKFKFGFE